MKKSVKCLYSTYSHPKLDEYLSHLALQNGSFSRLHYAAICDIVNKEPCIRTYAYKFTKKKGLQVKEIIREYIDRTYVSDDLYYTQCSGYQLSFKDEKRYYFSNTEQMSLTIENWYPNVWRENIMSIPEIEQTFKSVVPYLKIQNLIGINGGSIITMLRNYKDSHNCEMLVKSGFTYLTKYKKALDRMSSTTRKKLAKWLNDNKSYVYSHEPNIKFIQQAIKENITAENLEHKLMAEQENLEHKLMAEQLQYILESNEIKMDIASCSEMIDYIKKHDTNINIYSDYLSMSKNIGRNIADRGVRFPRSLQQAHEQVAELQDKKINRATNRGLKKAFKQLEKFAKSYKGLKIVFPKTQHDLVNLGNILHNCVGTHDFGKRMSKGECIVFGIYFEDKPVECCELIKREDKKTLQINQLYGEHNSSDGKYHANAEKLVNKFIQAYRPQNLLGACI